MNYYWTCHDLSDLLVSVHQGLLHELWRVSIEYIVFEARGDIRPGGTLEARSWT